MSVKTETKKEEIVKSASTTILERLAQNSARRLQVLVLAIHVMDQETKSVKSITSHHRYVTHTVYRLQETIRVTRILERGSVWRARREKTVMSARISTKKEEIVKIVKTETKKEEIVTSALKTTTVRIVQSIVSLMSTLCAQRLDTRYVWTTQPVLQIIVEKVRMLSLKLQI